MRQPDLEAPHPRRAPAEGFAPTGLRWWHFALPALVFLALGFHGFWVCEGRPGGLAACLNLLYLSVQLFFLESGMRCENAMPWTLEAARFLAPLVPASAVLWAVFQAFRKQLGLRPLRTIQGHTVICGLGRKGIQLVRNFRAANTSVVAIELDGDNDNVRLCQEIGAYVLIGSAIDEAMLRRARAHRAQSVVAISGDDGINVEIAMLSHGLIAADPASAATMVRGFVHIVDPKLCSLFKKHHVFANRDDRFEIRVFNIHESGARLLFEEHPLDWDRITAEDSRSAHLICVGFGQAGEAVILQAAKICHLANGRRLHVTVVDLQADKKAAVFYGRYPHFTKVCKAEFIQGDLFDIEILRRIQRIAGDSTSLPYLAICMNDDSRNLLAALHVREFVGEHRMPIAVRMVEVAGLATLIEPTTSHLGVGAGIFPFGMGSRVCTRRMLYDRDQDRLAEAIYGRTLATASYSSAQPKESTSRAWHQLDSMEQDSFRHQADHVPVKLRAIGCVPGAAAEKSSAVPSFSETNVDTMARMEHTRRCAETALSIGQHAAHEGEAAAGHLMVSWEDLSEDERELLRTQVKAIPELLYQARLFILDQPDKRTGTA